MPNGATSSQQQHELTRLVLEVLKEMQGDMSNVKLSEAASVSRTQLTHYFQGKKVPTVNEMVRLCEALNVAPSVVVKEAERRRGGGQVLAFPGKPGLSPSGSTVGAPEQAERAAFGDDLAAEREAQQIDP